MFSLKLTLLAGRYVATSAGRPSWPPEPDRIFSAMTAAWGRTGKCEAGREVLEWLEGLGPPLIFASAKRNGATQIIYVPQNNYNPGRRDELLPERRAKVERRILSVIPREPEVVFMWPEAEPPESSEALTALCRLVSHIGHSSSAVWLEPGTFEKPATFIPTNEASGITLRVPQKGRLGLLREFFARGQRPEPLGIEMVHYRSCDEPLEVMPKQAAFGTWEILRLHGNLPFEPAQAESLVGSLRRTLIGRAAAIRTHPGPVSAAISGHAPSGEPTREPHIAFVPLLDVGHRYSDGRIRGIAAIRPLDFSDEDEAFLQEILLMPEVDNDGVVTEQALSEIDWSGVGRCGITIETTRPTLRSLGPNRYLGPSRSWATVLPYRFEGMRKRRFSTPGGDRETLAMVGKSCKRIGLPRPELVHALYRSPIPGVRDIREFPPDVYGRRYPRRHLLMRFAEPVNGPVLIGADRFRGFGLCMPIADELTSM